jgi:hypothetical protein
MFRYMSLGRMMGTYACGSGSDINGVTTAELDWTT